MSLIITLPKPFEEIETTMLVPQGVYECEFISVEKRIGPSKSEFLSFKPVIYDQNGKKLTTLMNENVSLSENALWKLKRILEAMGYRDLKGRKFDAQKMMLFKRFNAEIIIEEYEVTDDSGVKVKRRKNSINDYFPLNTTQMASPIEQEKNVEEKEEKQVSEEDEVTFE